MGTQNGVSHDIINVKLFLDIDKNLQKVIQGTVKLQQDNLGKAPDTEECGIKKSIHSQEGDHLPVFCRLYPTENTTNST